MPSDSFKITICVLPSDVRAAEGHGFPLCHLAYGFGEDGRLCRGDLGVGVRGGLLGVSDRGVTDATPYPADLLRDIRRECDARGFDGVLCDFEQPPNAFTSRFAYEAAVYFSSLRMRFVLPEAFADSAPGATLLVSGATLGGSYEESVRRAVFRYGPGRAALLFEPVCVDFAMPSPRGAEDFVTPQRLEEIRSEHGSMVYFSHELSANYFTYRTSSGESRFALFDDERSMLRKLNIARGCGFREAYLCWPDVSDALDDLNKLK